MVTFGVSSSFAMFQIIIRNSNYYKRLVFSIRYQEVTTIVEKYFDTFKMLDIEITKNKILISFISM